MANPLHNYKILLADADAELGQIVRNMLSDMGFQNIHITRSGQEALSMLQRAPYDFLITEWNTQQIDGLKLIKSIRTDPKFPNPMLPIIMMSGRAEKNDVVKARDSGINEYIVKPMSAQNIYNRLERIIEQPRGFVVSQQFIGPDRRNKGKPPPGVADRRTVQPAAEMRPGSLKGGQLRAGNAPRLILPDYTLKLKLGKNITLKSLITPNVLTHAQLAIDAIGDQSLQWIKDNLREMKLLFQMLRMGSCPPLLAGEMAEAALSIHTRAATFGYSRAAEIAYALYLFCSGTLKADNAAHQTVIEKHIDVLHVLLGNNIRGDGGAMGAQIALDLKQLVQKLEG